MASSTIKTETVDWLYTKTNDITLYIENSCDVYVVGVTHHIAINFHATATGQISMDELIEPTSDITITTSTNTVRFQCPQILVLNVICKKGTAYFM